MPIETDENGMKNIIPKFKPGQKVRVRPEGFEKPCPHCGHHFGCYGLWPEFTCDILESHAHPLACSCGEKVSSRGYITLAAMSPTRNSWLAVPYTWLTPLENEDSDRLLG